MARDQSVNIRHDILNGFQVGRRVARDFYLKAIFNFEHQFEQAERVHAQGAEQRVRRQPLARQLIITDQYVPQRVECAHDGVPLTEVERPNTEPCPPSAPLESTDVANASAWRVPAQRVRAALPSVRIQQRSAAAD